jgi:hypothetical protein
VVLSCVTVGRLFVELFGGELAGEYRELVEDHLAACPLCLASADGYAAVIDLARRLPRLPVPPGLLDRLRVESRKRGIDMSGVD